MREEWNGFKPGKWNEQIDVADFISINYEEYKGDESFLEGPTTKTKNVWNKCVDLLKEELKKHVLDIDTEHMSGINSFKPGYIDKDSEVIVGLQTDAPLKRIVNPYGGIRLVDKELEVYNYKMDEKTLKILRNLEKVITMEYLMRMMNLLEKLVMQVF